MVTQCPGEATKEVEGKHTCAGCAPGIAEKASKQRYFDKQKAERRARQEEAARRDPRQAVAQVRKQEKLISGIEQAAGLPIEQVAEKVEKWQDQLARLQFQLLEYNKEPQRYLFHNRLARSLPSWPRTASPAPRRRT